MKTRYLNNQLKEEIRMGIQVAVSAKMEKSIPGKELKSLNNQIANRVKKLVQATCPDEDLKVLEKYKLRYEHKGIEIMLSAEGKIYDPWYRDKDRAFKIQFSTSIFSYKVGDGNRFLIDLVKADKKGSELCVTAFKVHEHIQCETTETVRAYMTLVNKFRTVKTLLETHPTMKKFIPKEAAPDAPPEPTRAEKLIAQFEAA